MSDKNNGEVNTNRVVVDGILVTEANGINSKANASGALITETGINITGANGDNSEASSKNSIVHGTNITEASDGGKASSDFSTLHKNAVSITKASDGCTASSGGSIVYEGGRQTTISGGPEAQRMIDKWMRDIDLF